jgi:hypothetical protein
MDKRGASTWAGVLALASRLAVLLILVLGDALTRAQGVVVISGIDQLVEPLKAEGWWGDYDRNHQTGVPRLMITGITERWQRTAATLPVATKKEVFYRLMLPLAVHSNVMSWTDACG